MQNLRSKAISIALNTLAIGSLTVEFIKHGWPEDGPVMFVILLLAYLSFCFAYIFSYWSCFQRESDLSLSDAVITLLANGFFVLNAAVDIYHAVLRSGLPESQLASVFVLGPVALYNIVQILGRLGEDAKLE